MEKLWNLLIKTGFKMKISELQKLLERQKNKLGDLEVKMNISHHDALGKYYTTVEFTPKMLGVIPVSNEKGIIDNPEKWYIGIWTE
jgi:hypothetical protein